MSNEEVVLNMVIHRLEMLLGDHEELKSKWSAEITEIILLGKGVLTPTSETKTPEGLWILALDAEEANEVYEHVYHRYENGREVSQDLLHKLDTLTDLIAHESMAQEGDDDLIHDEPIPAAPDQGYVASHAGIDYGAPVGNAPFDFGVAIPNPLGYQAISLVGGQMMMVTAEVSTWLRNTYGVGPYTPEAVRDAQH